MLHDTDDFAPVHQLLRYRPGLDRLDVTVAIDGAVRSITAHGQTVQNRANGTSLPEPQRLEGAKHTLRRLLAHYPKPVTVNGEAVPTGPFPDRAGLASEPRPEPLAPGGRTPGIKPLPGQPQEGRMLVEGLTYHYQVPVDDNPATQAHRRTAAIAYPKEESHPHWWNTRLYRAHPNYRWNPANEPQQQPALRFHFRYGTTPLCEPDQDGWRALLPELKRQLDAAAAVIRQDSGASRVHWGPGNPAHQDLYITHTAWGADWNGSRIAVSPAGTAVQLDDQNLSLPVQYSIALALYRRNCQGLTPVQSRHDDLPVVTCERVEIRRIDGATTVHHPAGEARRSCAAEFAPYGINAASITAHLVVTEPGGSRRQVAAPLDLYLHGEQYDESVWLTGTGAREDLTTRLQEAYADWNQSENEWERHRDHCRILETRIREGSEAGFQAELQQLCDRFWPQCRSGQASVTVSNRRHRLTWEANPAAGSAGTA